jgi:SAM-dependent methyltransferase
MTDARDHWERVYTSKLPTEVSWRQNRPEISLALIAAAAPELDAGIIDVGGGASTLVDALLAEGRTDVTVLDVSGAALKHAKARLEGRADTVSWIVADITAWTPARSWDVWHDRAVFHFLTERAEQDAYIAALRAATRPGAAAVISTFALDGPEKCSGLSAQRYSPTTLALRLGREFELIEEHDERHITPWGAVQHFVYAVFRRR